jgi:hypothetical protein
MECAQKRIADKFLTIHRQFKSGCWLFIYTFAFVNIMLRLAYEINRRDRVTVIRVAVN